MKICDCKVLTTSWLLNLSSEVHTGRAWWVVSLCLSGIVSIIVQDLPQKAQIISTGRQVPIFSYFFLFFSAYSYFSYFLAISSYFSYFLAILLTVSKYLLDIWKI